MQGTDDRRCRKIYAIKEYKRSYKGKKQYGTNIEKGDLLFDEWKEAS